MAGSHTAVLWFNSNLTLSDTKMHWQIINVHGMPTAESALGLQTNITQCAII